MFVPSAVDRPGGRAERIEQPGRVRIAQPIGWRQTGIERRDVGVVRLNPVTVPRSVSAGR